MKRIIYLLFILFATNNINATNYAILISAGQATQDNVMINSEYWYDLFLAYEDLILREGYTHENIIVFYGNGVEFNSSHNRFQRSLHGWTNPIVDFDVSLNTLETQFANLGNIITSNDNVHIRWVCGHGAGSSATGETTSTGMRTPINNDDYWALLDTEGFYVRDTKLFSIINQINNYNRRKIIWMTCHSGCIVEGSQNLNNDKTVIIASSNWANTSFSNWLNGRPYAELNYCVTSSLYGEDVEGTSYNADGNSDNAISMNELFINADNSTFMRTVPQLGDNCPRDIGTFIDESLNLNGASITSKISYEVNSIVATNYVVEPSGNVTFATPGSTITLKTGFTAENGSAFHAKRSSISCGSFKNGQEFANVASAELDQLNFSIQDLEFDNGKIEGDVEIYPSPVKDILNIAFEDGSEYCGNFEIYSIIGTLILQKQITENPVTINVSDFEIGTYVLQIKNDDGSIVTSKQFIKK